MVEVFVGGADSGSCFAKKEATRGMRGGGLRRLTELTVP